MYSTAIMAIRLKTPIIRAQFIDGFASGIPVVTVRVGSGEVIVAVGIAICTVSFMPVIANDEKLSVFPSR